MEEAGIPSKKQQTWGALLSIVVIMLMVIVGAFWAWGKHAADQEQFQSANAYEATTTP